MCAAVLCVALLVGAAVAARAATSGAAGLRSDEFDRAALDVSLWEFVNPGGGSVAVNGTQAVLSVGAGEPREGASAPRLRQPLGAGDFGVETKLDRAATAKWQLQGIIAEAGTAASVRAELRSDGSSTTLLGIAVSGGVTQTRYSASVPGGVPAWLRLQRANATWTVAYSTDGVSWSSGSFVHAFEPATVGPYVGTARPNTKKDAPAFTSTIDYFRVLDTVPPVISAVSASVTASSATVSWTTDEPATSTLDLGPTAAYGTTLTSTTLTTSHTLTATGLTCGTSYHYRARSRDNSGNETTSLGDLTLTTNACPTVPPGPPSGVVGSARDAAVVLSWTPPSSDGGSAITGYRITPYVSGIAQEPVPTGSAATTYTVTGLVNRTAYTFRVAAINAAGTGADSAPSSPVTPAPPEAAGLRSDEFDAQALDVSLWEFVNPGGGSASVNGTQALLSVAAGAPREGAAAPRLRQPLAGGDFSVETKLDAAATAKWQLEGIVAEAGAATSVRAELRSDASSTTLLGISVSGGTAQTRYSASVPVGAPARLRLHRVGSSWTVSYSVDGVRWTGGSFAQAFEPTTVGPYVGNARQAANKDAPSFTSRIDYFRVLDTVAPTISAISTSVTASSATVSWTTDEPATSALDVGLTSAYGTTLTDASRVTSHSLIATGLTCGTSYHYRVRSSDSAGNEGGSLGDLTFTTSACPDTTAPAISAVSASVTASSATVSWTTDEPATSALDVGLTSAYGTTLTDASRATSHSLTATGLTCGTSYHYRARSTDSAGNEGSSGDALLATDACPDAPPPPVTPEPPTGLNGSPRDSAVALTWTAPANDGGSAITGYRITPYVGGTPQTPVPTGSAATSHTVTGLANGTAYTFTVAAVNAVGAGAESEASPPVTPAAAPAARTVVSLTFDDNQVSQYSVRQALLSRGMRATFYVNSGLTGEGAAWRMSWSQLHELAGDGHEIAGHTLTHADLTRLAPEDQRREVCDDRTNLLGRGFAPVSSFAYPYGAHEQNDVKTTVQQCGYSSGRIVGGIRSHLCATCPVAESIPPRDPLALRTPPDIRTSTTLEMMKAYVTQAEQGGGGWVQLVFHYVCDACDEFSVSQSQLTAFLDWLAPRATDGTVVKTIGEVMGELPPPPEATPPAAPTAVRGTPHDAAVELTWTPPASTGGSAITGYRITPHVAGVAQTPVLTGSAATSHTVTGLANGTTYTFTVAALNAVGTGPESEPSAALTPHAPTVPTAPTGVSGAPRDGAVTLTWTAPASDGGSAVTEYRITPYVGGNPGTAVFTASAVTSHTVTGLTNGTAYTFTVAAVNAVGIGSESGPSQPVAPIPPAPVGGPAPMPVVSRGVPAYTNDSCGSGYPASYANDANYRTYWRTCVGAVSVSTPKWLAFDLTGVPAAKRSTVVVAWYNDPVTGAYDHTVINGRGYNIPGDYTVELNAAPGGTAPPATGWTTALAVTENRFNSRQHVVDMTGANWVRLHVTTSDGSPGNTDVAVNLDVHDASAGVTDSWIFYGDSITQDGMLHDNRVAASGASVGTFAQLVSARDANYFPAFQNGGIGGLNSTSGAARIGTWLPLFPGRHVALAYGTNDALAAAGDPTIAGRFHTNLVSMVEAVLAAGKVPIVPTIPWGRDPKLQANVPVLNAEIERVLSSYPQALRGPDFYALYAARQDLVSADGIHPTWDAGYAALREEWASFAVSLHP